MLKKESLLFKFRFYTASFSTMLLNLNVFGLSLRNICSPGFNCHGCPWATCACPIGVFTFSSAVRQLPLLAIAFIAAIAVTCGRLVCGFVCPFGWLQDILYRIPGAKIKLPRFMNWFKYGFLVLLVFLFPYILGFEKTGYLGLTNPSVDKSPEPGLLDVAFTVENLGEEPVVNPVVNVVFIDQESHEEVYNKAFEFPDITVAPHEKVDLPFVNVPNKLAYADILLSSPQSTVAQNPKYNLYFCKICPLGTLTAALPAKLSDGISGGGIYDASGWFSLRFIILYLFIILMILSSRPFCRIMCPLGAIYGLFAKFSIVRYEISEDKCNGCGLCSTVCPVGLDVSKDIGGMECIACGDCIRKCPTDAIRRKLM